MIRNILAAIAAAAFLVSCTAQEPQSVQYPAAAQPGVMIAEGTVTGLSTGHGNVYTSIAPDRYESLGLEPGTWIHVAFADQAIVMVIGRDYADVPVGSPVAVLHREGLTFAIRDGSFSATHGIEIGAPFTVSTASLR